MPSKDPSDNFCGWLLYLPLALISMVCTTYSPITAIHSELRVVKMTGLVSPSLIYFFSIFQQIPITISERINFYPAPTYNLFRMNTTKSPGQQRSGQYPRGSLNNDGKIGCLWMYFPTRLHPWIALKYIFNIDLFANICFCVFGAAILRWSITKHHQWCPWWGCYGHCVSYGVLILSQGGLLAISAGLLGSRTYKWLNDGSLPGKVAAWFYLRTFFYGVQLTLFFIQLAGWTTDYDWWEGDRDKIDASKRILIQIDKPIGTLVRVQGSYWNEINAVNWSIVTGSSNVLGWLYLIIIGFTARKAVQKCDEDRKLSLEQVRYQFKDLAREKIRLMEKDVALKIHDYNEGKFGSPDVGNGQNQVRFIGGGFRTFKSVFDNQSSPQPLPMPIKGNSQELDSEQQQDQQWQSFRLDTESPINDNDSWASE